MSEYLWIKVFQVLRLQVSVMSEILIVLWDLEYIRRLTIHILANSLSIYSRMSFANAHLNTLNFVSICFTTPEHPVRLLLKTKRTKENKVHIQKTNKQNKVLVAYSTARGYPNIFWDNKDLHFLSLENDKMSLLRYEDIVNVIWNHTLTKHKG